MELVIDSLLVLSTDSAAINQSPVEAQPNWPSANTLGHDAIDDDADMPMPRRSMVFHVESDDDSFLAPPRLSLDPLENSSSPNSIENARRAASNERASWLSRASLASIQLSDRFADVHEFELDHETSINITRLSAGSKTDLMEYRGNGGNDYQG